MTLKQNYWYIIIVFIVGLGLWSGKIDHATETLTELILKITHALTVPIKTIQTWLHTAEEFELLQTANDTLVDENVMLRSLLNFQKESKQLASFERRYRHQPHTMARILTVELSPQEHYCMIDKGSLDGVKKDMCAAHKTQLLGKVVDVFPAYSKVRLITDKNCKISVFVAGSNRQGICEGDPLKNQCRLRCSDSPQELAPNSMVISNGKGWVFPEGFLVGYLTKIEQHAPDVPGEWLLEVTPRLFAKDVEFCHLIPASHTKES